MKTFIVLLILFIVPECLFGNNPNIQLSHLPISHPVYQFLQHCEAKGLLEHFSLSALPLQRQEVISALRVLDSSTSLSESERLTLSRFEKELLPEQRINAAVFTSSMPKVDSNSFFFSGMFSEYEKGIYFHKDSNSEVFAVPLLSVDYAQRFGDIAQSSMLTAQAGLRIFGTLGNHLGYFFQATNGSLLSGDRSLALEDMRLRQNIKFAVLNSDFDFTESHIRYDNNWFYASIGRESRLLGAGFLNHQFLGVNSPPLDAIMLGARFPSFEYRFTHAALLSLPVDTNGMPIMPFGVASTGSDKSYPAKTLVMHRAAFKPQWGEIAIWESIIYQNRSFDLAYLNPLSFLKSIEHSLRDRDNSAMGFDFTVRPAKNFIIKGSYLLDDLIFSRIGTDFWGNKAAGSLGAIYAFSAVNVGIEYARVYPYTYSHFNVQNSMTSDAQIITGSLQPNSDEISLFGSWFFGGRYPLRFVLAYQRHGANEVQTINGIDTIIVNHGASALQAKRPWDSENAPFLGGILEETLRMQIMCGWELFCGFNVQASYGMRMRSNTLINTAQLSLRFEDF